MIAKLQQTRHPRLRIVPGSVLWALGSTGATLGVTAGFLQVFAGRMIPEWTGNKADITGLGLATVVLTLIAAVCLWQSRCSLGRWPRRLAAVAGVAAVVICFTTVGRLWYVPGPILMAALALTQLSDTAPRAATRPAADTPTGRPRRSLGWMLYVAGAIVGLVIGLVPLLTVLIGRGPSSVGVAAAVVFALGLIVALAAAPVLRRRLMGMTAGGIGAGLMGGGLVLTACAMMIAIA